MHTALLVYSSLACAVLFLHALFILWVVFGAVLTRWRRILRWSHIVSLIWGILTELLPWPCPLTLLENWLEQKAGVEPYHGGFLLHSMDRLVYPDISATALTVAGVLICAFNLAIYGRQAWRVRANHQRRTRVL
jgi:vacuolar-type H+-ATPase subunit I/STV1